MPTTGRTAPRLEASRADAFSESVIREMTRLAIKHKAINLAQGFPDFPCPDELKKAACDAVNADINQYAITWGAQELREALAAKVSRYNHMEFDPVTEITVTCGSTEAMMASMLALITPGDEVIVPEPFYENYGPDAIISGAIPKFVPIADNAPMEEERWKEAFSEQTRAIIINTPNNPTGKVFSLEELRFIADLCIDHDVIAVTDEIYEHILYDGRKHISIGSLPGMEDRTITIGSFSKTYSVTGWRVGYTLACQALSVRIRKIHDFLTVGAPAPLQAACAVALSLPDSYYRSLGKLYESKRQKLFQGLSEAGFKCHLPEGAYYIFTEISDFGMSDIEFATYLVEKGGIAAVPGSSFYSGGGADRLRFTFSKKDETLEEACRRLRELDIQD
ncbi:MAG: aminotransferase class I/II-fold pyridoxal phosphate-dependent enzyme [Methanomicrobiales archaeon]|nr:aminotransferase class I/II-fold pyridoxal phosphate-dependent enzyme [Methanomicrobiales archaeon]